jgi:hypothetical protein
MQSPEVLGSGSNSPLPLAFTLNRENHRQDELFGISESDFDAFEVQVTAYQEIEFIRFTPLVKGDNFLIHEDLTLQRFDCSELDRDENSTTGNAK